MIQINKIVNEKRQYNLYHGNIKNHKRHKQFYTKK